MMPYNRLATKNIKFLLKSMEYLVVKVSRNTGKILHPSIDFQ